jgi:holo-[acyl-carrier protein] synthase
MVIGIGIDIIEIERIKNSIENYGDQFLKRIYTKTELDYCLSKNNKYQHLAARFAAKEAIYKAFSTGMEKEELTWQDIEIYNEPNGMPVARLSEKYNSFLSKGKSLKISMSHSRDYVTCVAIIYKNQS